MPTRSVLLDLGTLASTQCLHAGVLERMNTISIFPPLVLKFPLKKKKVPPQNTSLLLNAG